MKKLITVVMLVAGLAVSASGDLLGDYYMNPELTLQNEVKNSENLINDLIPKDRGDLAAIRSNAVLKSLSESLQICGVNSNLALQFSNGTTINISPGNIAVSLAKYMQYLSDFNLEEEMLTKYFLFTSRPTSSFMNSGLGKHVIKENSDGRVLNSVYTALIAELYQEDGKYTFYHLRPTKMIIDTYCYSNYKTDTVYGHLDIEFNEFLYSVLQKDYETANDILNDVFTGYRNNASEFAKEGYKTSKIIKPFLGLL